MTEKLTPTVEDLTNRTRVMRVSVDREILAKRAKKDTDDDGFVDDDALDDDEEDDRENGEDDEEDDDARALKLARRAATRAVRRARVRAAAADADLLPIAISSEFPVERMDWWTGERYDEILVHSAQAIDLSRAKDGLPFLDSHDAYTGKARMGRILNVRLGKDKVLRGDVKFSRRQDAQDLRQDFLDGIACEISVGYKIDQNNIETSQKDNGPIEKRINRWMPYEASSVSVPADPTVGAGRSAGEAARRQHTPTLVTARNGQEITVPEQITAPAGAGAVSNERSTAQWADSQESKDTMKRIDDLLGIAAAHGYGFDSVREWNTSGKTVGDIAQMVLAERKAKGAEREISGKPAVELTHKETRQYSMHNAVRTLLNELDNPNAHRSGTPDSFEREISQELEKKFPVGSNVSRHGGLLVPTFTRKETVHEIQHRLPYGSMGRAGLDSATATKGQELKFTVPGEFLVLLRNFMATMNAGATMLGGLEGPVAFPNQTSAGTATWMAENSGADVAESNVLLSQIALNPKALQSTTSYSRQLLAQSVIDVDGMIRTDLAQIMALALDLAGIAGTGASNQPTGITNTSGIGSVAGGTNGLTPTYAHLVDLETQVTAANADQWPLSYLVHPTTRGTFKKATILSNTIGLPAWQSAKETAFFADLVQGGGSRVPGELNGYTAWASAQVPNALTKGSASGTCLAILFGAFSQLVYGDWGMMEIIVDPYRLKKQGMIELTSFGMYGVAVKYPAAFAAMKDALA